MAWDFICYTVFTSHEKISFGDLNDFRFNEFQFFHSEPKSTHCPTNKKPHEYGALLVFLFINHYLIDVPLILLSHLQYL